MPLCHFTNKTFLILRRMRGTAARLARRASSSRAEKPGNCNALATALNSQQIPKPDYGVEITICTHSRSNGSVEHQGCAYGHA